MNTTPLNHLDAQQLREMVHSLIANVTRQSAEIVFK